MVVPSASPPREGLVLHTVAYGGRWPAPGRPHAPRSARWPSRTATRRTASGTSHSPFDLGENIVGTLANSLALGCDCLGEIRYLDAVVVNAGGRRIPQAICLHEEDFGLLWKHWTRTEHTEVRRSRRFVISFIATVATTSTASTGTSTRTGRSRPRSRRPGSCRPRGAAGRVQPRGTLVAPQTLAAPSPALLQPPLGHRRGRAAQHGLRGRHGGPSAGPGNPLATRSGR